MMDKSECVKTNLCPVSLGIAIGIVKGLCILLFAWAGWAWGYGTDSIVRMGNVLHGYAPTLVGGLWGGLWGLILGFVFGLLVGLIYNFCLNRCCRSRSSTL